MNDCVWIYKYVDTHRFCEKPLDSLKMELHQGVIPQQSLKVQQSLLTAELSF